jgi:hypothetical protein
MRAAYVMVFKVCWHCYLAQPGWLCYLVMLKEQPDRQLRATEE